MIFRIMWAVSDSKRYNIESLENTLWNTKPWVLNHEVRYSKYITWFEHNENAILKTNRICQFGNRFEKTLETKNSFIKTKMCVYIIELFI